MSFPDHYQITERTRFRVRYEIHPGREFAATGVYWLRGFETVEDCQRAYIAARQASGLGASQFGEGNLFDQAGQHLARISYNGRLWSPVPWHSGLAPLAEAPEISPQEDRNQ